MVAFMHDSLQYYCLFFPAALYPKSSGQSWLVLGKRDSFSYPGVIFDADTFVESLFT